MTTVMTSMIIITHIGLGPARSLNNTQKPKKKSHKWTFVLSAPDAETAPRSIKFPHFLITDSSNSVNEHTVTVCGSHPQTITVGLCTFTAI